MDLAGLTQGRTRETSIRRDATGRWWNGEDPITHPNLVRSFEGWIARAEDGRYCLANDINWAYFTLEGAPYFVRSLEAQADGLVLHLSGDRSEKLTLASLRQGEDGSLWTDVLGGLPACFDNHAAAQLASFLGEDAEGTFVEAFGERVYPPVVSAPMG